MRTSSKIFVGLLLISLLLPCPLLSIEISRNPPSAVELHPGDPPPVIGRNIPYRIGPQDSLIELARTARIGYQNLVTANPGIDPWLPQPGEDVILPYESVLPAAVQTPGILVNLAELRLYYIWEESGQLKAQSYPVGIGIEGWDTPEGEFTVTGKLKNPGWTAPPAIRKERPDDPVYIPPGPDNPLGEYWIQLRDGYGIHGTNRPFGVGRRVSHGCIRLYPEHIRELFRRVNIGTPVRIVYQPIKIGLKGETLVMEAHPDYLGRLPSAEEAAQLLAESLPWERSLQLSALAQVLRESRGVPVPISEIQAAANP